MRSFFVFFAFVIGLLLVSPLSGQPTQDIILLTSGSTTSSSEGSLASWLQGVEPEATAIVQSPSGGQTVTSVGQLSKTLEAIPEGTYQLIIFREEDLVQAVLVVE